MTRRQMNILCFKYFDKAITLSDLENQGDKPCSHSSQDVQVHPFDSLALDMEWLAHHQSWHKGRWSS